MSPTVFRADGFRLFFPEIELAMSIGLKAKDLAKVERLIRERERDIRDTWHQHFGS